MSSEPKVLTRDVEASVVPIGTKVTLQKGEQLQAVIKVDFAMQPMYAGIMELQISFTVGASPTVHSVGFTLNGTGVEVTT